MLGSFQCTLLLLVKRIAQSSASPVYSNKWYTSEFGSLESFCFPASWPGCAFVDVVLHRPGLAGVCLERYAKNKSLMLVHLY